MYNKFMERYYIIVSGIVQGVGYRYTVVTIANNLNLTGSVRNLDNGNVEIEVQGDKEVVDEFIKEILKNRRFIQIYDYQIKKIPLKEESSFNVKF